MEYKCNSCNKLYKSYQSLWNHNHKFHTNTDINVYKSLKTGIQNVENDKTVENSKCKYCNKKLSNRQSRWRHEKTCDKNNNINNAVLLEHIKTLTNKITQLEDKLDKKQNVVVNNIVNNGSINNNSNNKVLNICSPGDENVNLLTDSEKKSVADAEINSIIKLIDVINFNERLPQYHNFYVSALNDKHVNAFDSESKGFIKKTKSEVFDKMLFAYLNMLAVLSKSHKQLKEYYDKLCVVMISKKYKKIFHNEINVISYNKQQMIIDTAKLLIADVTVTTEEVDELFDKNATKIEEMPEDVLFDKNNTPIEKIQEDEIFDDNSSTETDSEYDGNFNRFLTRSKTYNKNIEKEIEV